MTDTIQPVQEEPKLTEAENYRRVTLRNLFFNAGHSPENFQLAIEYYLKNPGAFVEGTVRHASEALWRYTQSLGLPGEWKKWGNIFMGPEFHEFLYLVSRDKMAEAEFHQAGSSDFPSLFMRIFREAYHGNKQDEKALKIVARHFLLRLHEQTQRGFFLSIKNKSGFFDDPLFSDLGNVYIEFPDEQPIRMGDAAPAYLAEFIESYKKSKGAEKLNALHKTMFWTAAYAKLSQRNSWNINDAVAQCDNRAYGPRWLKVSAAAILPLAAVTGLGIRHQIAGERQFRARYADVFQAPVPIRLMPDPAIYSGSIDFGGRIEGLVYSNASSEDTVDFRSGAQLLQDLRAHVTEEAASGQPFTIYQAEYSNLKGHILSKAPKAVFPYYFMGACMVALLSAGMMIERIERRRSAFRAMAR